MHRPFKSKAEIEREIDELLRERRQREMDELLQPTEPPRWSVSRGSDCIDQALSSSSALGPTRPSRAVIWSRTRTPE